ncbi:MAG: hypothetical protein J0M05_14965, partial [Candidatus Kapabacteria bacterium]|nr:hypothetical protein [Candidatus Kapabacteria bacterium]
MKHFISCIIICLLFIGVISAQMEYNNWIVQPGIQLRFLPTFKASLNIPDSPPFRSEAISTISDPVQGNLLFYQGVEYDKIIESNTLPGREYVLNPINSIVKNKEYKKIQSQYSGLNYLLHGGYSIHQSFLALPSNYECGKYILLSLVGYTDHIKLTDYHGTLAYNTLDIKKNKGKGEVLQPLNNVFYKNNLSEGLAGTIHANGKDYWIISSINLGATPFVAIPIINDRPDTTQIKFSSESYVGDVGTSIMISPNSKFIYASRSNYRQCRVYNFDNQSGAIAAYLHLDTIRNENNIPLSYYYPEYVGGEFSYNSRYLYIIIRNNRISVNEQQKNIIQIDLQSKTYKLFTIPFDENERFVFYTTFIYLAPDNNIYFATSKKDNSEVNIWRITSTDTKNPEFTKIQTLYKNDLQGEAKSFEFPYVLSNVNFSHHVFDPNYKRIPTLCDLPKMLPFDTSICVGEWLTLSPKFESLPTMNLWQWEAKNADIKTGNDSLFTTRFLSTGTFPVRFIGCNANGCDTNSIQVTVYEKPTIVPAPDYTLCPGESVRIGRMNTPVFEYSWSPADYLDNPKSANPLCTPEKNMQYILTIKNSNGCENYDTVNVTLGGELSVFAGADTSVCEGEQIQLNASGAENFSWSPAEGLSNATIANPIFTGTSTTQYIVTGKSGNCEGKDTILVTVNEKPIIITSENREICLG